MDGKKEMKKKTSPISSRYALSGLPRVRPKGEASPAKASGSRLRSWVSHNQQDGTGTQQKEQILYTLQEVVCARKYINK